jgi:response regulator NasT
MQKLSVLIADDDAVIRMDLRTVLEELGHSVVGEAACGPDACRLARALKPSVAILDVMMPAGSGLGAAAVLSRERICPVILLTAYSEAPVIEEATRAGVLAFLVKPFARHDLQPAIEIATARFRELLALEGERDALSQEIATAETVQRAEAVLVRRHAVSDREAQRRLQAQAISLGRPLRAIAEAVLLTAEMDAPRL